MKIAIPPIKTQGKKTGLVNWVKEYVPKDFDVWVEPFMGSGVVGFNIRPKSAIFADTNPHIIRFYQDVQRGIITPESVFDFLKKEGDKLSKEGEKYYYAVRERFNESPNSFDFLFLNRSCFNGVMRFNRRGRFNVPFCRNPKRFSETYINKICSQIKNLDTEYFDKYTFVCGGFEDTLASIPGNSVIYCDPPYIGLNTKYHNRCWDEQDEWTLYKALRETGEKFILSTWARKGEVVNPYLDKVWSEFSVYFREHNYFVGGHRERHSSVTEALVVNF